MRADRPDRIAFCCMFFLSTIIQNNGIQRALATQPLPSNPATTQPSSEDIEIAKMAEYVYPTYNWRNNEFCVFLKHLTCKQRFSIMKALEIVDVKAEDPKTCDAEQDLTKIKNEFLWRSSNILTYPFRSELNYHDVVMWAAEELEVDEWLIDTQPTIVLERAILERIFAQTWDKLNVEQRAELLNKIDPQGDKIADKAKIAAMGGTAALATLATTVAFSGFAFYTTMSITICTVASWLGVTLPFSAYVGVSSIVAFLSGPVGWAVIAIGAVVSTALAGRADVKQTAAAIIQIHLMKVTALEKSRQTVPDIPKRPS